MHFHIFLAWHFPILIVFLSLYFSFSLSLSPQSSPHEPYPETHTVIEQKLAEKVLLVSVWFLVVSQEVTLDEHLFLLPPPPPSSPVECWSSLGIRLAERIENPFISMQPSLNYSQ